MLFSQLRHRVSRYARVGLLAYVMVLSYLLFSDSGRSALNNIGQHYMAKQDQQRRQQVEQLDWAALMALGDISRHHRYAAYKDKLWFEWVESGAKLDKSHIQWAERNRRNINMQLALAKYYGAKGKTAKQLKLLRQLYVKVPQHVELAAAYRQALQQVGAEMPTINVEQQHNLREYFAQ